MDERISRLLTLAVAAPSGDNCQPWRFTLTDGQLNIYNLPQKDTSFYNYDQQAALIAQDVSLDEVLLTDVSPFSLGIEHSSETSGGSRVGGLFSPMTGD